MRWWVKAALLSIAWIALVIGIGIYHTEVYLKGVIDPAQDAAISRAYGVVCGFGVPIIWALFFRFRSRKTRT